MDLRSGTRFGPYEIVGPIGAGGMGAVYRGRDTRLGREVALKFALDRFSDRFAREARAISSLNHPNICQLYDVGDTYLVMELVAGESPRGPYPLDVALEYARQIADALEAAHDRGIVHRDLKPSNIKITPDGVVKVLDFGLAKELTPASAAGHGSTLLPTDHTQTGAILGTAAYMAPEQAQGKPVDSRSDIWGFGVVVYELITGGPPFEGSSVADTVAAVLTREPDWALIPRHVQPMLRRCLAKNPKQRLRHIGDAAALLEAAEAQSDSQPARSQRTIAWVVTATALAALLLVTWSPWRDRAAADDAVRHWVLNEAVREPAVGFDLSRDGKRIVYAHRDDPQRRLWVRDLNRGEAQPIAGTDRGRRPSFSPDGQWFAFFTGTARSGHLKKVPATSGSFNTRGAVTVLCENANLYGASWGEDGHIIFSGAAGLMRVNASGGACEPISKSDPAEADHRWPQVLEGKNSILFTIGSEGAFDAARIAVLDLNTGKYSTILDGGARAKHVPSGHLVFVRSGQMFAVRFDIDRLQVRGTPQVVVDSLFEVPAGGFAAFAFSDTGLLLYQTPVLSAFEWHDRAGTVQRVQTPPRMYSWFRLSPDGRRVAVQEGRGDIEIVPLDQGAPQRITTEWMNHTPIWTPDGSAVTFGVLGKGIFETPLAGSLGPRELRTLGVPAAPAVWTSDRKTLLYVSGDPQTIWMATVSGAGTSNEPRQILGDRNIAFYEPDISPDGRWLTYVSTESGAPQVHVQRFPQLGSKATVSTDGGTQPRWSRDGRELFYLGPDGQSIMSVNVRADGGFSASEPRVLVRSAGPFDVHPDGQRFVVLTEAKRDELHLVTNWFSELRSRVATVR